MQVVYASYELAIESNDHIAFPEARLSRRTAIRDRHHDNAVFAGKIVKAHQAAMQRHSLRLGANVAAADSSVAQQASGNKFRGIDSDREAQALRHGNHGGVHAHHLSGGIHQRAPEFPGFSDASVWMTSSISRPE